MIAFFDTSALIPLLIEEPASERAGSIWDGAAQLVAVSIVYAEARAALAQAHRSGRIPTSELRRATHELEVLYAQIDRVAVTDELVALAGDLAERHELRGYDAIHLAGALLASDTDVVLAAGDADLLRAADEVGLAVVAL